MESICRNFGIYRRFRGPGSIHIHGLSDREMVSEVLYRYIANYRELATDWTA
jgi:hypothetical protein